MMPLAFARDGALVRVVGIRAGRGLHRRLNELGIIEGNLLRVVKSRGPGPVIIEVLGNQPRASLGRSPFCIASGTRGGRLLLGFGAAMKIMVEEVVPS